MQVSDVEFRELACTPWRMEAMVEQHGLATDKAYTETWWCGLDIDRARPHLLRIAKQHLTDVQLTIVERWLAGDGPTAIAEHLGVTKQVIDKSLNGRSVAGGTWVNGSLAKLRVHLIEDDAFIAELVAARAVNGSAPDAPGSSSNVRDWFKSLRSNTLGQFIPRCVLLVISSIVDAKRETTYAQLYEHLPRPVIAQGMPMLKTLGYVSSDGVRIKLIRTPLEDA